MGKNSKLYDVAIIGAGPAGLMAAITAARNKQKVIIVDQKNILGKKIPATGNGRCNFTNDVMELSCFRGDVALCQTVLNQFGKEDVLRFFSKLGVLYKQRNGYYYPYSDQASTILDALTAEIKRLGVSVFLEKKVVNIEEAYIGFSIQLDEEKLQAKKVIVATGLLASPKLGSDGSMFDIIKALGHRFTPIVPALCGFEATGMQFKNVAGVRAEGRICLWVNAKQVAEDIGEIQYNEYGISGIPVFQISRYVSYALHEKQSCKAYIDLLPQYKKEDLLAGLLVRQQELQGQATLFEGVQGWMNQKLLREIFRENDIRMDKLIRECSKEELSQLIDAMKCVSIVFTKSRGYEFAQICAGGIRAEEVRPETLESRIIPNLYFAGEILDVDGICGGYNLQWAWASGYVAGKHAAVKE